MDPDEYYDVDPNVLHERLGVEGEVRRGGQSGAGHPSDEENDTPSATGSESEWEDDASHQDSESQASSSSSASTSSSSGSDIHPSPRKRIRRAVAGNTRHKAVKLPRRQSPFEDEDEEDDFLRNLDRARAAEAIPEGFGFLEGEEGYGDWDDVEYIQVGKVRRMEFRLVEEIWKPRIVQWVQAVQGLTLVLEAQ